MLKRESDELKRNGISLVKKIGSGSFSDVFSGRWKVDEQAKNVALKIMQLDKMTDERFERVFLQREIDISKKVSHPSIVELFQVFELGRSTVLVFELCECDLLQYLQQRGALSEKVSRRVLSEIVSAVSYLHRAGIAHRDLKTENVFLASSGRVKLGDFGFARFLDFPTDLCVTRCGSDGYFSPELIRTPDSPVNPIQADIWALGVVLFAMVTKSMPFDMQAMHVINRSKHVTLKFHPRSTPSAKLKNLIGQFLAFEPDDRISLDEVTTHEWYSKPTTNNDTDNERPKSSTPS